MDAAESARVARESAGGERAWASVAVWPSLVLWVVHLLEEWVLFPWIQSKQLGLGAFTSLVELLPGGFVTGS